MPYDPQRAADMALALMYLELHDGTRVWKGYPWEVLDTLFESGMISNPKSKAKSVVLTEEGMLRSLALFRELLDSGSKVQWTQHVRPKSSQPGTRGTLSELQKIQVERLFEPICKPHANPKVNAMVRKGYRIEGAAIVLFESRPAFMAPHNWQDMDIAKFRFNKSRGIWQLFCQFRDLRWRAYEPMSESPDLSELVAEVEKDPTGIFWG